MIEIYARAHSGVCVAFYGWETIGKQFVAHELHFINQHCFSQSNSVHAVGLARYTNTHKYTDTLLNLMGISEFGHQTKRARESSNVLEQQH